MYPWTSKHKTKFCSKKGSHARNITQQEYKQVLRQTLLPEGRRLFSSAGVATWTLQQDNDPAHKAEIPVLEEWNMEKGCSVQLLPNWPPNSPDLNLIENVWAYVQAKVNEKGCSSFEEFNHEVIWQRANVPQRLLGNLHQSMPKRIRMVIENDGGKLRC
jgi:hypothetical protein